MGMVIWGQGQVTLRQYLNSLAVPQYQSSGADDAHLKMAINPRDNTTNNRHSDNKDLSVFVIIRYP